MRYSFALAFMTNTFAVTVLLIALGLTGNRIMAAEVGVVQASTLALLYAFSANARSLILNRSSGVSAYSVMVGRLLLLGPLAAASYWLSVNVAGVDVLLAIILILRKCIEWVGEVHLSEMERLGDQDVARKYFALQSILMTILLAWLIGDFRFPLLGLFIWAFLPLLFSLRFIRRLIATKSNASTVVIGKILPNLGSTAIIGITVYIFRLLILLVADKETAGDLYTAFAIGGVTGSIFANALGASIALHEQNSGKPYLPPFLRYALNLSLMLGIVIWIAATEQFPILTLIGKSYFFWKATGLSLIGGVVMVYAQQIRFRLLQHDSEHDVFGPDVLMNILIFTSVPFLFYVFGREALSALYLVSSLMAYIFYASTKKDKQEYSGKPFYTPFTYKCLRMTIAVLLLLPLFFQLSNGVFRDPSLHFASAGVLTNLPLPFSILACAGGILLMGAYQRAFISFGYIFLTCVLMVMSSIILTQSLPQQQQAKFLLLIQFILPMFALVLGQVYEPIHAHMEDKSYAKAFFWVLLIVVPLQLIFTWQIGLKFLSPRLGLFSIYQHLQYVPVIFVSAYILSLFNLWDFPKYKIGLLVISICMTAYSAASLSLLTIGLFFSGLLFFALFRLKTNREKLPFFLLLLALVLSGSYFQYEKKSVEFKFGYLTHQASKDVVTSLGSAMPTKPAVTGGNVQPAPETPSRTLPNLAERLEYWKYYIGGITSTPESLFLGVSAPPDRAQYPSAHNYYLDFIYNFGLIAMLPTLFLIGITIMQMFRQRQELFTSPALLSLSLVVLFLLIVDNSMKVSLRQPYPGIFTFFLWGVLITKLSRPRNKEKQASV